MKKIMNIIAFIMLLLGFLILSKPYLREWKLERENDRIIKEFSKRAEENRPTGNNETNSSDGITVPFDELYENMKEYNQRIYEENQSGLRDVFSYTTTSFDLPSFGIIDDVAGYITIEKIGVTMAMYIGSNKTNMSKGATIMNQTSMPVGGMNTNCVIAAHRSRGFLAEIEQLEPGDEIQITNLWQTLRYKVVKIIVIEPFDIDKVKIIPGQDMVTLLTCHPYGKNTNRYVVYCVRDDAAVGEYLQENGDVADLEGSRKENDLLDGKTDDTATHSKSITAGELPDGMEFEPSEKSIHNENTVRICGMILTGLFLAIYLFMIIAGKKSAKKTKQK